MKDKTIEECYEAANKLVETIDNADHSDWHWEKLGEALDLAEKVQSILAKVITDDELARHEEANEYNQP